MSGRLPRDVDPSLMLPDLEIPRTVFIVSGLGRGGAEAMLHKLLSSFGNRASAAMVLSLSTRRDYLEDMERIRVPVVSLGLRAELRAITSALRIRRETRRFAPAIVQGWMYHGNIAALFTRSPSQEAPAVLWSIRASISDLDSGHPLTAGLIRVGASLSSFPKRIIYNSRTSARQHEALGYDASRTAIIPNGFDTSRFRPDDAARREERGRLGRGDDVVIIGLVARIHPIKDQATFLQAAAILCRERLDVAFVLVGYQASIDNPALRTILEATGLLGSDRIHLMAELHDVARLTNAFDIACSSSRAEAFSNVLGEAMATGVPCVATDVGDSAWLVGDGGIIVPPKNPEALAMALRRLILASKEARRMMGARGRARVEREFPIADIARRYAELYRDAALPRR